MLDTDYNKKKYTNVTSWRQIERQNPYLQKMKNR